MLCSSVRTYLLMRRFCRPLLRYLQIVQWKNSLRDELFRVKRRWEARRFRCPCLDSEKRGPDEPRREKRSSAAKEEGAFGPGFEMEESLSINTLLFHTVHFNLTRPRSRLFTHQYVPENSMKTSGPELRCCGHNYIRFWQPGQCGSRS